MKLSKKEYVFLKLGTKQDYDKYYNNYDRFIKNNLSVKAASCAAVMTNDERFFIHQEWLYI